MTREQEIFRPPRAWDEAMSFGIVCSTVPTAPRRSSGKAANQGGPSFFSLRRAHGCRPQGEASRV